MEVDSKDPLIENQDTAANDITLNIDQYETQKRTESMAS
jgi:magnesium-transporting ATPase (P-type)